MIFKLTPAAPCVWIFPSDQYDRLIVGPNRSDTLPKSTNPLTVIVFIECIKNIVFKKEFVDIQIDPQNHFASLLKNEYFPLTSDYPCYAKNLFRSSNPALISAVKNILNLHITYLHERELFNIETNEIPLNLPDNLVWLFIKDRYGVLVNDIYSIAPINIPQSDYYTKAYIIEYNKNWNADFGYKPTDIYVDSKGKVYCSEIIITDPVLMSKYNPFLALIPRNINIKFQEDTFLHRNYFYFKNINQIDLSELIEEDRILMGQTKIEIERDEDAGDVWFMEFASSIVPSPQTFVKACGKTERSKFVIAEVDCPQIIPFPGKEKVVEKCSSFRVLRPGSEYFESRRFIQRCDFVETKNNERLIQRYQQLYGASRKHPKNLSDANLDESERLKLLCLEGAFICFSPDVPIKWINRLDSYFEGFGSIVREIIEIKDPSNDDIKYIPAELTDDEILNSDKFKNIFCEIVESLEGDQIINAFKSPFMSRMIEKIRSNQTQQSIS